VKKLTVLFQDFYFEPHKTKINPLTNLLEEWHLRNPLLLLVGKIRLSQDLNPSG
jgi:hypothetical protein